MLLSASIGTAQRLDYYVFDKGSSHAVPNGDPDSVKPDR
jgi:hypothetical protein